MMLRGLALAGLLFGAEIGAAQAGGWHAVAFMYHRFGEDDYPSTSISLDTFEAHLDHLEEEYTIWPMERIVEHLENGEPVPDRTVAITIDDAYRSVYENAFPILKERDLPYTVFVATEPVDDGLSGYMTWDQMREMEEHGATFANHSTTHDYLVRQGEEESDEAYAERIRDDISNAQDRIEEELGEHNDIPMLFAYPYGEYNQTVADVAEDLGYIGIGQHSGAIGPYSHPMALPRFPMADSFSDLDDFKQKAGAKSLPVESIDPWDPVAAEDNNPPRMEVTLADSDARLNQLACFVGGQGSVEVEWTDRDARIFEVEAPETLNRGRTRYNCTAPSEEQGRFYWFSQQWIILPD
ncbi:polysaccharide deacetylase family protein [Aquisalimonas asiatica]|uniref:Peptidoglycan/xylan/chitin deacetylase, PgdA/CDA1 family n=1 Tax=Aquisalimonas asiatica TaxID=406100 RepID=A0A1H8PLQ8_9GAMM|nr:polysaccharide deacetylase family protein [Aquisalimonas asiatica]SEO42892.1 Peptidoglycan/xylan/chitin deacetylase, PgdA/CDA1 family [Aquisalimonas asiatica]